MTTILKRRQYFFLPAWAFLLTAAVVFLIHLTGCERAGKIRIDRFEPQGEVGPYAHFTVVFSDSVFSREQVGRTLEVAPFNFSPSVAGRWLCQDYRTAIFSPSAQLKLATKYAAVPNKIFEQRFGVALRQFAFHTPFLVVRDLELSVRALPGGEKVTMVGSVRFNLPVSSDDLAKHLVIVDERNLRIPFEIAKGEHVEATTLPLLVGPLKKSNRDRMLRVRITEGLMCVDCTSGLQHDFETTVRVPKPGVLKVTEFRVTREDQQRAKVAIRFNRFVEVEQLLSHLTIEPTVQVNAAQENSWITLRGKFRRDTLYTLLLSKELMATDGSMLSKDFRTTFHVKERLVEPEMHWVGSGYYLPPDGHLNLGLSTINVQKVYLRIWRIFPNNLVYMLHDILSLRDQRMELGGGGTGLGSELGEKTLVISAKRNKRTVTPVDVREFVQKGGRGVYYVQASRERIEDLDDDWDWWWFSRRRTRWFVVTDLGLVVKRCGPEYWVWVNSLSRLAPLPQTKITLLSENNQVIASALTNGDGIAILRAQQDPDLVPFVILAEKGKDFAFVRLDRPGLSTSDFNVGGIEAPTEGYWAYLYGDRDIYRPGETVHLVAVVRDIHVKRPESFPAKLQIISPDERIVAEYRAQLNDQGAAEFAIQSQRYWVTGTYLARLMLGDEREIGRTTFDLQEFIPDRIKVTVLPVADSLSVGDSLRAQVNAVNLFGPPAVGRLVRARVSLEPGSFSARGWKNFTFGSDLLGKSKRIEEELAERKTDTTGSAMFEWKVPEDLPPGLVYLGSISCTVLEPDGRAVTRTATFKVFSSKVYLGIRPLETGFIPLHQQAHFELIALDRHARPQKDLEVHIKIYRRVWHTVWRRVGTRWRTTWRWVTEHQDIPYDDLVLKTKAGPVRFSVTPTEEGEYVIEASAEKTGAKTVFSFSAAGWGYGPWAVRSSDRLRLVLSKSETMPGETVQLQVRSPYPGKLLLTFERDGVLDYRVYNMRNNTATVTFQAKDAYSPNIYLWAQVIRKPSEVREGEAARAYGVIRLVVKPQNSSLRLKIRSPAKVRPGYRLSVEVSVSPSGLRSTYLTIAAVDEGICQLTGFKTPNPWDFFYGIRRLSVQSFDTYGVILPDVTSKSSPPGGVWRAKEFLAPVAVQRVKPVALWSGLIKVGSDGVARVTFDVPEYSGSLRVMAVAFSDQRFGAAESTTIVSDRIVVSPTFPRFVACGDSFILPVRVSNTTLKRQRVKVRLHLDGPAKVSGAAESVVEIPPGGERYVDFPIRAQLQAGKLRGTVTATGAGTEVSRTVELGVEPPLPVTSLSGSGSIRSGHEVTFVLPGSWLEGTSRYSVAISSVPLIKFRSSLDYLIHYPYGCVEQTTSSAFPLLYLKDLASRVEPMLREEGAIDYFVDAAIEKLSNMQLADGTFSFWPGGTYVYPWGSLYASHFLVEAKKAGYEVPNWVYTNMLNALQRAAQNFGRSLGKTNRGAIYACYILALAGRAPRSSMLALKNNYWYDLDAESRFTLAAAFAAAGDMSLANSPLPEQVQIDSVKTKGDVFGSSVRATALVLSMLLDVNPGHAAVPRLAQQLGRAATKRGRWLTTQENAFALMALGKLYRRFSPGHFSAEVWVGDAKIGSTQDGETVRFEGRDWAGKPIRVRVKGTDRCFFSWVSRGVPKDFSVRPMSKGIKIRRTYLDRNGKPIALSTVRQGDIVICHLQIESTAGDLKNVAIVDMLPAGLEIENPRLESREDIPWLQESSFLPDYLDLRDDRIILFTDLKAGARKDYYYATRAITAGQFVVPPPHAEAMYDPEFQARGTIRMLNIVSLGR